MIKRFIAIVVLSFVYAFATVFSQLLRPFIKRRKRHGRIIINATFHNPNWFFAHIEPITRSDYGEVLLIADEAIAELPGLKYFCPPKWASKILSRAIAKALWTFFVGLRYPADIFVGYHIFPSSVTALLCARLFGAKAIYQVTYGEAELEGGGWAAENALLTALGKPSAWVEKMALRLARQFDLLIVRGSRAKAFLQKGGCDNPIEIVTGSVESAKPTPADGRDVDIIFVARMAESKRPLFLLEVIAIVAQSLPQLKVFMLGEGDQLAQAKEQAEHLKIGDNVEFLGKRKDVMDLLARSKVFVLPSRWEGVSIALMEAMMSGVVPVVSRVGDMADFVSHGETGYIFDMSESAQSYADCIIEVLSNDELRKNIQTNANRLVMERSERKLLAKRWLGILETLKS